MTELVFHVGIRLLAVGIAGMSVLGPLQAAEKGREPVRHASVGSIFKPTDVDFAHPVYASDFSDPRELSDWVLEGGRSMRIEDGRLILESAPAANADEPSRNHLVCWLKQEAPADFLCEIVLRPQDKRNGLNIIFFSTRGLDGRSVFDPSLAPRDGTFVQYHSGDLQGYHVSYWAAPRSTTHIRKNRGFHLVAVSELDEIAGTPPEVFVTLRIYKRADKIRVMVNDRIVVAWDDDGRSFGPAILHSGWIGLRQMGYTQRTDYDRVALFPLTASP
jgi:hypothetical protein